MVKVGGCVYQEVFKKQLLIIKVRLLLQNWDQQKVVRLYLSLFRFCIMNSSWIINHQKGFEMQLLIIKVITSSNDCFSRIGL